MALDRIGTLARLEVDPADVPRVIELHDEIVRRVREAGYRTVTLDLQGYRSGSLKEGLNLTLRQTTAKLAQRG